MAGTLAYSSTIDPRAVAAAEIVYSDRRRLHFQTAMVAGDIRVEAIGGHGDVAILGPANDVPGRLLEDIFLLRQVAVDDGKRDPRGGIRTLSVLLLEYLPGSDPLPESPGVTQV